jgi:putative transposase
LAQKKTADFSLDEKRRLIKPGDSDFTIEQQCELLGISRSTYYYEPCCDNPFHLEVMREIDMIYTAWPFYGKRRMSIELQKKGYKVGIDLARTLMKRMGIEAIYARPNLSVPHPDHKIYPYLLRGMEIKRVNQVWSTDITYLRMRNGFLYLTAVLDWYSRYVIAWKLSNSLDSIFCREVLMEALEKGKPEIFNTDQGAQYTSVEFTKILIRAGIVISMDGRGRALDNVWIERLWRTVKQEEVYIRDYVDGRDAYRSLEKYIGFYNNERPHSSLGYKSPATVYWV